MAKKIIDERTLAGWLSAPTEDRARVLTGDEQDPVIAFADIEEHVADPDTGITRRCDLTLRSKRSPLMNAEMKRPEVDEAASPALQLDSWKKAVSRGMSLFATCNFREIYVWETAKGPNQVEPRLYFSLLPGLSHSGYALNRRAELGANWRQFLDALVEIILPRIRPAKKAALPPQAVDLKEAILHVAEDVALRIRAASSEEVFRHKVLDSFRSQFGVEMSLDPLGNADKFHGESEQVALISVFVVTTRLILYQALSTSLDADGKQFDLDELDITRLTSDPQRVASELEILYYHARKRTRNFELQLSPTDLDHIVFVDTTGTGDIGHRWGKLLDVVKRADWTGPAGYVPGLYESLLDDEHRHVLGVHYTPDPVAEMVSAYVVRSAADRVMDPSSGAGTFATMCYARKRQLGSSHQQALSEVYAVELADFAASLTGLSLTLADTSAGATYPRVFRTDFFNTNPGNPSSLTLPSTDAALTYPEELDGVIGNPPYIRFENRSPQERRDVHKFLERQYNRMDTPYPNFTGKADIWSFFVAGAHAYLRPGGRLGFVLSWNLLASDYGDAVLSFLGRYFMVDAIIDSRVERWFAAKQNTVLLLATRAEDPPKSSRTDNPNIPQDHYVRFVRLKQPLDKILDLEQSRGKKAEDVIDELLDCGSDVEDDLRWDVRVFLQRDLLARSGETRMTEAAGSDG